MINLNIPNPVIFYSQYGYIQVDKNEFADVNTSMLSFIKRGHCMTGKIKKDRLRETINIKCKTFYGKRQTFPLEVNINEKLSDIIIKISIIEEKQYVEDKFLRKWNRSNQYRFIASNGRIKELNPFRTFAEESIGNNDTIILLSPIDLNFSELNKGNMVYLDSKSKAAFKHGGDELQFALTEQGYSCGKNYCEFTLDTEPYERSVIIGVSLQRTDFLLSSGDMKGFWGFVLSECKKIYNNATGKVEAVEYGDATKIGDKVGVMIEFNQAGVDISFYINKIDMGVAFKNLPLGTYFPAAVLGFDGTKIKITNNVGFPDV